MAQKNIQFDVASYQLCAVRIAPGIAQGLCAADPAQPDHDLCLGFGFLQRVARIAIGKEVEGGIGRHVKFRQAGRLDAWH